MVFTAKEKKRSNLGSHFHALEHWRWMQVKLTASRNRFMFFIQNEFYLRLCVHFSIFHNLSDRWIYILWSLPPNTYATSTSSPNLPLSLASSCIEFLPKTSAALRQSLKGRLSNWQTNQATLKSIINTKYRVKAHLWDQRSSVEAIKGSSQLRPSAALNSGTVEEFYEACKTVADQAKKNSTFSFQGLDRLKIH